MNAQQISTDNSQQPNELIQNLVGNNCATVSNISSSINGSSNNIVSYGSFDNNTSNFPLQSGLILSTGRVSSAGNTLNTVDLSEGNIEWVTDPDIQDILGIDQTLNATAIEFDFSSANNFISFKYLFASDEYQQEYPCTFQDVFAILIKRSGTTDPYINIAIVPDTTTEISTNTIHPNITGFCEAENEEYFRGYNLGNTNFNGRTEVLTARADIIPNETYHIKLVIADHIDQRFDSAVFIEAEGFGNSIDLGPDQTICGSDITLNAEINNPSANYAWYLNGNEIAGENGSTLEVNQSGIYEVEISIPSTGNNCTLSDTIEIEIIPFQEAAPISAFAACDPAPGDGIYDFDFPLIKNDEIFDSLPSTNYLITYHLSQDDAQNNISPITGIYNNTDTSGTIFVRIQSINGDCLQIGSFNFTVSNAPITNELTLDVCNGALSELAYTNLSNLSFPISVFEFNTVVSYYLSENDAANKENALSDFPDFENEPSAFFARVEDDFNGCASIVPINLVYVEQPNIGRYVINNCLDPNLTETVNGETYNYDTLPVTYNIFDIIDAIEAEYPELTVQILTFIIGVPPLITTADPSLSVSLSLRYVGQNCPTNLLVEIHKNLLYNLLEDNKILTLCDDNSNDGIVDIDLSDLTTELKDGFEIDLNFYATEEDRTNESNPLDQNTTISVSSSDNIFVASSFEGCTHNSKISFNINPGLNLQPLTLDYCGNTNPDTNTTNITLPPLLDTLLEAYDIAGSKDLYLSLEDAENQENKITGSYDVVGDQQVFYVRASNVFTGCFDITTLQVNINNAIEASNPEPIIICDDDQDGFATVNLENVIPQLSNGSDEIVFTFFESFDNAVENELPIVNTNNYTTETANLFIRAEIVALECFTIFPYDILIYANPELNSVSDYINCEIDPNTPTDFLFINKDSQIISGQTGMQVLYFETEDNAINRINPIDKNVAYLPISNPQTIFVRLENEAGNGCFKVAPMQIEVRQAPIYNNPTDVFECDINNTGFATTDLNEKIIEISTGSTTDLNITFHLTPLNANIGANEIPINFTATSNPQLIYARIENTISGCFETPTFLVNTLSLPDVNFGQSLTKCGNNYNFSPEWNLTEIEPKVLEGRQYNIGFAYFESEEDLITDNNPIINPEAYINTSNPQTIYVKIINATTGCFETVPFNLILNSPPQINPFETYNICENTFNLVDLLEINETLVDNTFNVIINYYLSEADAEAKENPLESDYLYTNTTESLFARIEYSTTNCYTVHQFQLIINPLPTANPPNNLITCDDDFDGFVTFNLTQQNATVLGNQSPDEFSVTYYNSEINANNSIDALNTEYSAYDGEIIFVRLENNTTGCYATQQFSVIINPLPVITIEDQVICLNNLPLVVSANTNNPSDSYLWSTNVTSPEIEIFEIGTYSVTVTNQFGCDHTSTFSVTESESATIDVVETIDFSDPNNITVTIIGIGNYLFQINNGSVQTSNVFQNVPIGYNTITIIDQNGCAQITREVLVLDTPKHMSPNDDGAFDTWHITGVETLVGTVIQIFDRKGKLIKILNHNSLGWDGTYNGHKMPASDYWYVANIIQNGQQFQVKGHFALKR